MVPAISTGFLENAVGIWDPENFEHCHSKILNLKSKSVGLKFQEQVILSHFHTNSDTSCNADQSWMFSSSIPHCHFLCKHALVGLPQVDLLGNACSCTKPMTDGHSSVLIWRKLSFATSSFTCCTHTPQKRATSSLNFSLSLHCRLVDIKGEPNGRGGYGRDVECAYIWGSRGRKTWDDTDCQEEKRFVCEKGEPEKAQQHLCFLVCLFACLKTRRSRSARDSMS